MNSMQKIDIDGWYKMALKGVGFKGIDDITTELILQTIKVVDKKKGETDLKDLADTQTMINQLFGIDNAKPVI